MVWSQDSDFVTEVDDRACTNILHKNTKEYQIFENMWEIKKIKTVERLLRKEENFGKDEHLLIIATVQYIILTIVLIIQTMVFNRK